MNCHETAALLASYSDGELDPIKSAAIEKHLLGCAECATRRDELSSLRVRIRAEVLELLETFRPENLFELLVGQLRVGDGDLPH